MLDARTISISIDRDWKQVYEAVWRPRDFPKWASGLSSSALIKSGDSWIADSPDGKITIHFTDHNAFGIMDHTVDLGTGTVVYVPLRVIPNGAGAEVMLTLFRQPGMTPSRFEGDAKWVKRDLVALKALVMA